MTHPLLEPTVRRIRELAAEMRDCAAEISELSRINCETMGIDRVALLRRALVDQGSD